MDDWISSHSGADNPIPSGYDEDSCSENDSWASSFDKIVATDFKAGFAKLDSLLRIMLEYIKGLDRSRNNEDEESELPEVEFADSPSENKV